MTENIDADQKENEYIVVYYEVIGQNRELRPDHCASIGKLTQDELQKFKEKSEIKELSEIKDAKPDRKNDTGQDDLSAFFLEKDVTYFVCSQTEIYKLPLEERVEYIDALRRYENKHKPAVRSKKNPHMESPIDVLWRCVEIADTLRKLRIPPVAGSMPAGFSHFSMSAPGNGEGSTIPPEITGATPSVKPTRIVLADVEDKAEHKLKKAVKEAMLDIKNPQSETAFETERWDMLSREKYNKKGWTKMAKISLQEKGKTINKASIESESNRIRTNVTNFRKQKTEQQQ